jgi:hypothetical protein
MNFYVPCLLVSIYLVGCSVEPQYRDGRSFNSSEQDEASSSKRTRSSRDRNPADDDGNNSQQDMADNTANNQTINTENQDSENPAATPNPTPAVDLGLKNATVDPADPTIAIFTIGADVAAGWNTRNTMVEIDLSKGYRILRILNNSGAPRRLHTGGRPCGHQGNATPNGQFFDCVLSNTVEPGNGNPPTYDHDRGTGVPFFLRVFQSQ